MFVYSVFGCDKCLQYIYKYINHEVNRHLIHMYLLLFNEKVIERFCHL